MAKSCSVICGARLTMRCAGASSVTRRPSLSIADTAPRAVNATHRIDATMKRMERFYRARRTLMIQGTSSGAGKSTLVAGLCRAAARRGKRVAPFKPQNMSLNSAVAADGGEIARAQALQAQAARVAARTDMNPVLLKPSSDTRAQLVVNGRPLAELEAGGYQGFKERLLPEVLAAFERLRAAFDGVIIEGAGSPAEVNLRANDIANMGFAEAADCPVLLVADIDGGGALAHIVGTLACLSGAERERIVGFVINRFRGARPPDTRNRVARERNRQTGARRAAFYPRACARRRGCAAGAATGAKRSLPRRRAGLSAHQQPHRSRRAGLSPGR